MQNDPELSGKYLGTITKDFVKVADYIKEASYQIRSRKLSEHPIFVLSKVKTPLGALLIDKDEVKTDWNYSASYLGEFVERTIIAPEKEEMFKETYKNADEFCCLFVLDHDFTNFVYLPYPED